MQRLIAYHFPLLLEQKAQRDNPPRTLDKVDEWVKQALAARMTIEQIFSATGLLPGERKKLREIEAAAQEESSSLDALPDPVHGDAALLSHSGRPGFRDLPYALLSGRQLSVRE